MNITVQKSIALKGQATPPSSKSQSIRGIFFALLASGESILTNTLDSEDMHDAIRVCQSLTATITLSENKLILNSNGLPIQTNTNKINTGNSGITTRFLMPILGLRKNNHQPIILDCGEQMRKRPISSLVNALRNLGINIQYLKNEGSLPVSISGILAGGITEVDGITSQYLSALLVSLPMATDDSQITVKNLNERPYVEMTLDWLKKQKIEYSHTRTQNSDTYKIRGNQHYQNFHTTITGDFSSASYLIAASVLAQGCVEICGIDMQDHQGDKKLVSILQTMGADITIEPTRLIIHGGKPLLGMQIDANDIPDLLPTLAVIGTQAQGKTIIYNVKQARLKETDRIHSMTEGLKRLGAVVEEQTDGMIIYQSKLKGTRVKGYGDHRTVMALVIAGMQAEGATIVEGSEAIEKTFPTFIKIMRSLGANI